MQGNAGEPRDEEDGMGECWCCYFRGLTILPRLSIFRPRLDVVGMSLPSAVTITAAIDAPGRQRMLLGRLCNLTATGVQATMSTAAPSRCPAGHVTG